MLLAEDHSDLRALLVITLDRGGFDVFQFEDGQAALDAISEVRPEALITDLTMPRLDGFALISASRRLPGYERLPTLVFTALDASDPRVKELKELPRLTVMQKPPSWRDLVPELERLIES